MQKTETVFSICVNGHDLISFDGEEIRVDGNDFHADLRNMTMICDMMSDIINAAKNVSRPKLITAAPSVLSHSNENNLAA